ncbi:MAG TPA: heme-binding protein [Azospirillaceae bacterium]|nr:heme-binding protein [Azospirillaceae bacterium]
MTTPPDRLTLDLADRIADGVLAAGREKGLKPLTVAVLDPGGHLVVLKRQDGSSTLRPEIATGKAASALALGVSSRRVAEMAAERPVFVAALGGIAPKGMIPAAGGVLLQGAGGVIGAVGVTGDTSDNDEACALDAIRACGLQAGS